MISTSQLLYQDCSLYFLFFRQWLCLPWPLSSLALSEYFMWCSCVFESCILELFWLPLTMSTTNRCCFIWASHWTLGCGREEKPQHSERVFTHVWIPPEFQLTALLNVKSVDYLTKWLKNTDQIGSSLANELAKFWFWLCSVFSVHLTWHCVITVISSSVHWIVLFCIYWCEYARKMKPLLTVSRKKSIVL